ncbi:MAG: HlyD family secretion protein [Gemmatimonadetes bacterium]|nr:HlyD family secretion protein [Gemmatimonadota bacterium]
MKAPVPEPSDSPEEGTPKEGAPTEGKAKDPARVATLVVLSLCVVFFGLYLWADRVMPYSDQARVSGFTVSVVPLVSGYVTDIEAGLHEPVAPGEVLLQIDTTQYEIAVRSARASLDNAIQQLGVQNAAIEAAAAGVAAARAQETIARRDYERILQISARNADALSQADRDRALASLSTAEAQVSSAEAELRRAQAALGVDGLENPTVRSAIAALEQAEFNLAQTVIRAPSRGAIESLYLDVGHFAGAGQALMTFVSTADVWIQADLRENNLENLEVGHPVRFLLDVAPGQVFEGTVRSVGLGVSQGRLGSPGQLPQVSQTTGWLRQPQQFPVIIDLGQDVPTELLRVGAQASVMIFTGDHVFLNSLGRLMLRFFSLMSYVR